MINNDKLKFYEIVFFYGDSKVNVERFLFWSVLFVVFTRVERRKDENISDWI